MAGLLDDITEFIGGSPDPKTMDASGLTQADRRQSLYAGLTDIGSKLWAAGEPMFGNERARYLASIGSVPANMAQMRTTIAQQRILGMKSAEATRQMQTQAQLDAMLKDPAKAQQLVASLPADMRELAIVAMRQNGAKGLLEFLGHADQRALQRAQANKATIEAGVLQQQSENLKNLLGGGGAAPAAPGQPPAAVPGQPPAAAPSQPPAAVPSQPPPVLTPQQQVIAAPPPPSAVPQMPQPVIPQGAGEGPDTPVMPEIVAGRPAGTEGPRMMPDITRLPVPGTPTQTPPTQTPPTQTPTVTPPVLGGPRTQVELPPTHRPPRTVQDLPLQQRQAIAAMPMSEQGKAIAAALTPKTKTMFHVPTGQFVDVVEHAPPHPDFAPKEHAEMLQKQREFAQKALNDSVILGPDGKPQINEDLARAKYVEETMKYNVTQGPEKFKQATARLIQDLAKTGYVLDENGKPVFDEATAKRNMEWAVAEKAAEAMAQAQAQQVDRQRTREERDAATRERAQASEAASRGQTTEGKPDPDAQRRLAEAEAEKQRLIAEGKMATQLAEKAFDKYNDTTGPVARASGAKNLLPLIYEAQDLVNKGVIDGPLPELRQTVGRYLESAGFGKQSLESLNRTSLNNLLGRTVIDSLTSGRPLGSQVSDADRKFMENISGQGSFTQAELKRLLSIAEGEARKAFADHKGAQDRLVRNFPQLAPHVKGNDDLVPPDRDEILKEIRARDAERIEREKKDNQRGVINPR